MLYCKERQQLLVKRLITFLIYKWIIGRASGSIYKPVMVNTMPVLPKTTLKFMQNISFWATSQNRKLDDMLQGETCIGDKCLITFLRCMNIIGGASASIYKPLMAQAQRHFCKNSNDFSCKISYFRYPLCTRNTRVCYKERCSLLIKCFITFLRYISMGRRAYGRIYNHHMIHTVSFLQKVTLKFYAKYQLLGTLSEREMGYCAVTRYLHPLLLEGFITFYIYI